MDEVLDQTLRRIGSPLISVGYSQKVPQYGDKVPLSCEGLVSAPEGANDNSPLPATDSLSDTSPNKETLVDRFLLPGLESEAA